MDVERGLTRVWKFILGVIWALWLAVAISEFSAFEVGEYAVYMLVFSVGWALLGRAMLWVVRGFRRES